MSEAMARDYQVVKAYPHGTFSWLDLASTDAEAAKNFYSQLFDWEIVDMPLPDGGVYTMLKQDGHDVAGLSQMSAEQKEMGMPSYWSSYIAVDNVGEMVSKVEAAGGKIVVPPFDVMEEGRMAVIQDSTGGTVCMWEAKNHIGAKLVNVPNSLVWNELVTNDVDGARAFYGEVFGWEANLSMEEPIYYSFMNGGRAAGGLMEIAPEWGDMPPSWFIYIAVKDVAAKAAEAESLGGKLMMPPTEAQGVGTFSLIQDPTGAMFYVIAMTQADAPPGY
ncbi:MAG TPA: VOC family protein [Anaerolineae bacterium]|nr:VOC family protein [Anaerolineae bacterium]